MDFSRILLKNRIANLVINDHSIRFVELRQANPPTVQKCQERILPPGIIQDGKMVDPESFSNILDECIDEWRIHKRSIRFLIPDSVVIIRKISIPLDIQDDEIEGYLYLELGSSIHLPFEDPVFDIHLLSNNEKTKDILLFAAPEKSVMEYAELFSSLKLNPVAADISPLALYRLYYQLQRPNRNENFFTFQFDLTGVTMCIFEDTIPNVMRQFPLELTANKWDIVRKEMDMEYTYLGEENEIEMQLEDVLKEVSKLMDFYRYSLCNGKKEVSKFLLNGDHPFLNRMSEKMKDRFDAPVHMLNLEDYRGKGNLIPAKFYLSLGLALKEVR